MSFFNDTPTGPYRGLSQRLAKDLVDNGIPITPGAAKRWESDIRMLCRKHGEEAVRHVLQWLSTRHNDRYVPRVRSGKALKEKWGRLGQLSGVAYITAKPGEVVYTMLREEPMAWPFPDQGEAEWLATNWISIEVHLALLAPELSLTLGPASHCVRIWRRLQNGHAWSHGCRGFEELTWCEDSMVWSSILGDGR
jgi:hypothetical protein